MRIVVKIGTSSLTHENAELNHAAVQKLVGEIAQLRACNNEVVLVTSGAIALGLPRLNISQRPKDIETLQAAAAVGQNEIMRAYDEAFAEHKLITAQVLFSASNFFVRNQYLHARATLERLLELGVVPVANENDAVADDEIRFGDNDRIAALIAQAIHAELLVLLTDTAGLYTADPRRDPNASLVEEITEVTNELRSAAGGAGTARGSGGMASKLAAARMASWAGVRAIIAAATKDDVLRRSIEGAAGIGTVVVARQPRLTARKVWIAFAMPSEGTIFIDDGAADALRQSGRSLLPAGVVRVDGDFEAGVGVDIRNQHDELLAKGVTSHSSAALRTHMGRRSHELPTATVPEVVHRDDLVLLR